MSSDLKPPKSFQKNEQYTHLSRSPHPYHRKRLDQILRPDTSQYLPSPALTPYHSDSEKFAKDDLPTSTSRLGSPSESGTEADDEGFGLIKALPAPPIKPRKGLRDAIDQIDGIADTQFANNDSMLKFQVHGEEGHASTVKTKSDTEAHVKNATTLEVLRRSCEILLMYGAVYQAAHTCQCGVELLVQLSVMPILCSFYALKMLWSSGFRNINTLSTFDPAPLLYPALIPLSSSLLLRGENDSAIIFNIVLSLSTIPVNMLPNYGMHPSINSLHWLVTMIPVSVSQFSRSASSNFSGSQSNAFAEILTLLYPMHQALLKPLGYLTTSSLLFSELQLLSVALINLLYLSRSPHSVILSVIMWIGGVGIFVCTASVLKWNVTLERIPRWRFKQARPIIKGGGSFLTTLSNSLSSSHNTSHGNHTYNSSNDQVVLPDTKASFTNGIRRAASLKGSPNGLPKTRSQRHKRALSINAKSYLSMTAAKAEMRKWLYAAFTYLVVIILILGPIRMIIASNALHHYEPFGWALGYLFGDVLSFQQLIKHHRLERWIPIANRSSVLTRNGSWLTTLTLSIGISNVRLILFGYWALVVAAGILTVLFLRTSIEVDTRRKVFHGTMVFLLLPTTYIDPPFLALALALVLSVFLLLELFRAAQIRPLSRPLAAFLAPYVDGRDLRGPVVVSHIFLLIGCAVPLWLSLAGVQRIGDGPWSGWGVAHRDVGMLAGVVCVGMGDAAASLVGRRIGRHKWPWEGGKSLEGSAAFAVAVIVGLGIAKIWLKMGGWDVEYDDAWVTGLGKMVLAACGASLTEAVLTGCNDNVVVPLVLWLLVKGLRI